MVQIKTIKYEVHMSHLRFLLCFSTSAFSLLYFSVRYTKTQVIPEEKIGRRG